MSNSIVVDENDNFDRNVEWFSVEKLHRTMRHFKQPIEKPKLRKLLTNLEARDPPYIKKQEGRKQDRPQAKGEYALTNEGKIGFREYLKIKKIITGTEEND